MYRDPHSYKELGRDSCINVSELVQLGCTLDTAVGLGDGVQDYEISVCTLVRCTREPCEELIGVV